MRRAALVLTLLVASSSFAEPSARSRGWLSGAGVGFVGLGLGLAGFGLSQQLIASDPVLGAYAKMPQVTEAASIALLDKRSKTASTNAVLGFVGGGVLLAAGIVFLVLDTPTPVAVVPLEDGGAVVFSGQF